MSAVLVAGVGEGEPDGEVLDGAAARELTDRIRDSLGRALEAIAEFRDLTARAWRQRAWVGLGYASWEEYCEQEFSATAIRWSIEQRQALVAAMLEDGMSQRAIAPVLGVNEGTVRNDKRAALGRVSTAEDSAVDTAASVGIATTRPDRVTGSDGRSLPATRTTSRAVVDRSLRALALERQGRTQREIAARLGVSQPRVSEDLARARELVAEAEPAVVERILERASAQLASPASVSGDGDEVEVVAGGAVLRSVPTLVPGDGADRVDGPDMDDVAGEVPEGGVELLTAAEVRALGLTLRGGADASRHMVALAGQVAPELGRVVATICDRVVMTEAWVSDPQAALAAQRRLEAVVAESITRLVQVLSRMGSACPLAEAVDRGGVCPLLSRAGAGERSRAWAGTRERPGR